MSDVALSCLNAIDVSGLGKLPGIGHSRASRLVSHRPYTTWSQVYEQVSILHFHISFFRILIFYRFI